MHSKNAHLLLLQRFRRYVSKLNVLNMTICLMAKTDVKKNPVNGVRQIDVLTTYKFTLKIKLAPHVRQDGFLIRPDTTLTLVMHFRGLMDGIVLSGIRLAVSPETDLRCRTR